jgi:hypothetical protein
MYFTRDNGRSMVLPASEDGLVLVTTASNGALQPYIQTKRALRSAATPAFVFDKPAQSWKFAGRAWKWGDILTPPDYAALEFLCRAQKVTRMPPRSFETGAEYLACVEGTRRQRCQPRQRCTPRPRHLRCPRTRRRRRQRYAIGIPRTRQWQPSHPELPLRRPLLAHPAQELRRLRRVRPPLAHPARELCRSRRGRLTLARPARELWVAGGAAEEANVAGIPGIEV